MQPGAEASNERHVKKLPGFKMKASKVSQALGWLCLVGVMLKGITPHLRKDTLCVPCILTHLRKLFEKGLTTLGEIISFHLK